VSVGFSNSIKGFVTITEKFGVSVGFSNSIKGFVTDCNDPIWCGDGNLPILEY
jgi:hypothetical protein